MKPIRFLVLSLMIVILTACNSSLSNEDVIRAYNEWVATLREEEVIAPEVSAGQTRVPVIDVIGSQATAAANATPISAALSTACNLAVSGMPMDVTIPDGTRLRPGQSFSKTWRLVNAGSCNWGQGYSAVWFSGELLSQSRIQFLRGSVQPGQSIDVTIEMIAPKKAGVYQSNWKLSDPNANLFGIGPNGAAPFWVMIEVIEELSSPTMNVTATVVPTLEIYSQGDVRLEQDDQVDLESGQINAGDADDLAFRLDEDQGHILIAVGSARMAMFGVELPNHMDCQNLSISSDPIALESLTPADFICYRTGQALPGYFRLIETNLEENTLDLEFVTWAIP
jgi:adhesin HecA-like repeat protein